jgi:hypothetical protein
MRPTLFESVRRCSRSGVAAFLAAAADASGEEALKNQLFPDQGILAREEQRRFEILLAHRDLPIVDAREMIP